jgi:hypothetical protein
MALVPRATTVMSVAFTAACFDWNGDRARIFAFLTRNLWRAATGFINRVDSSPVLATVSIPATDEFEFNNQEMMQFGLEIVLLVVIIAMLRMIMEKLNQLAISGAGVLRRSFCARVNPEVGPSCSQCYQPMSAGVANPSNCSHCSGPLHLQCVRRCFECPNTLWCSFCLCMHQQSHFGGSSKKYEKQPTPAPEPSTGERKSTSPTSSSPTRAREQPASMSPRKDGQLLVPPQPSATEMGGAPLRDSAADKLARHMDLLHHVGQRTAEIHRDILRQRVIVAVDGGSSSNPSDSSLVRHGSPAVSGVDYINAQGEGSQGSPPSRSSLSSASSSAPLALAAAPASGDDTGFNAASPSASVPIRYRMQAGAYVPAPPGNIPPFPKPILPPPPKATGAVLSKSPPAPRRLAEVEEEVDPLAEEEQEEEDAELGDPSFCCACNCPVRKPVRWTCGLRGCHHTMCIYCRREASYHDLPEYECLCHQESRGPASEGEIGGASPHRDPLAAAISQLASSLRQNHSKPAGSKSTTRVSSTVTYPQGNDEALEDVAAWINEFERSMRHAAGGGEMAPAEK